MFKIDKKQTEKILDQLMGRFAFKIQKELIRRFPTSFKNKIYVRKTSEGWVIGSNDKILIYFEQGTRPHIIEAKFKKSLAFNWPVMPVIPGQPGKGGKYMFKKIKHPGTSGKHLFEKLESDEGFLKKLLDQSIRELGLNI